ncbi:hemolysin family protein [Rhizohabitans arisaemae]|uniref:hemolysin family protein n=1 Tax=Rhizohabitans arisaemae TaxID=2720610 RepID=UPI0024B1C640|nr:hemolysin family protein [Rhizohabitans arisaemae]
MNVTAAILLSVVLLLGNGFFVAAEFALVAARRHRLEQAVSGGGRMVRAIARVAVRSGRELSLMLAGAQLGITLCTLGLGIVAEPAIAHLLEPLMSAIGLPPAAQHPIAFLIALALVTFLHMVVGEMAPKSWALTHPEQAALGLAVPFRAFTVAVRPIIRVLNGFSNLLLRLFGVHTREEMSSTKTPPQLAFLVGESGRMGLLDRDEHDLLTRALRVQSLTVDRLMVPIDRATAVPSTAATAQIREAALHSGHLRLLVNDGSPGGVIGAVHIREVLTNPEQSLSDLARPIPRMAASVNLPEAVSTLQEARSHIGLVLGENKQVKGMVSLSDLVGELLDTR